MNQIIFVTISMVGGGTERVIATLANYYVKNNFGVSICMIGGNEIDYKLEDSIEIVQISGATGGNIRGRINRINKLREKIRCYSNPYVIAMGTVASMFTSIATIGMKCKLILSERNDPQRLNHRPIKCYETILREMLYIRADKIVFQTDMARDIFSRFIQRKSEIILNPLSEDIPEYREDWDRQKIIVFAGRLTEQKKPLLLLEAFNEFHKEYPDYMLEYYGEGDLKETIINRIDELKLTKQVKVCGFSKNLFSVFKKSSIYISCSEWEGISNSLMEATAMGVYIIATDCPMGGSKMVIDQINYGKLISINSKEELINAMMECCKQQKISSLNEVAEFREKVKVNNIASMWIS